MLLNHKLCFNIISSKSVDVVQSGPVWADMTALHRGMQASLWVGGRSSHCKPHATREPAALLSLCYIKALDRSRSSKALSMTLEDDRQ